MVAAANYLGVSPSLLRKWRGRGPDDPGSHGPEFIKVGRTLVLYEIKALDAWLDRHIALSAGTSDDLIESGEVKERAAVEGDR